MSRFIPAAEAYHKLKFAEARARAVYIYGATGYGKTRLVQEYLKGKKAVFLLPRENEWEQEIAAAAGAASEKLCVVIDDMQLLRGQKHREIILKLLDRRELWVLMLGRMQAPHWLIPKIAEGNIVVISEEDLHLSAAEVMAIAAQEKLSISSEDAGIIAEQGLGNAYIVRACIQQLLAGNNLGSELTQQLRQLFYEHLEKNIIPQWDVNLQEFLMQMSVVEKFTLPLAVMVTGDDRAADMIDKAVATGNFLVRDGESYIIRRELLEPLRRRALKQLGLKKYNVCRNNAGLYFETHRDYSMAMQLYEAADNADSIKSILIRNARQHPGNGMYYELRHYYLSLDERETESSPVLMAALSMLHSIMMNPQESEKWYEKLAKYASEAAGGEKREANELLLYLDIGLPHRGAADLLKIIKRTAAVLKNGGMTLPEFAVTANQPSAMNGGKDFCRWSRHDYLIAGTIGPVLEKLLGSPGKGIVHTALCESLYEKGGRDEEALQHALMVQMAADSGGKTELLFAAVTVQIRKNVLTGKLAAARSLLDSFEERAAAEKKNALFPNISALRTRLELLDGNTEAVEEWLKTAPDEKMEFWSMERFRYITKVRCYLAAGQNDDAIALLGKLLYYADVSQRPYVRMDSGLLMAAALRREGREWKQLFLDTLNEICGYSFVRIISEKGACVLPLLKDIKAEYPAQKRSSSAWFNAVLKETESVAKLYPEYLKNSTMHSNDLNETAIAILRMQSQGLSIKEIAAEMSLSERTIKYHAAENYRKLGAKGKTDAVQIARRMKLI